MNRGGSSTYVRRTRNAAGNEPEMNSFLHSSVMSASYDSGVGNELDVTEISSRMNQSTYSPTADTIAHHLERIYFEEPDNNHGFNPDENKENDYPYPRSFLSDRAYIHGITERIASRGSHLENDNEQGSRVSTLSRLTESGDLTSPRLAENGGSTSPFLTESGDLISPRLAENGGSTSPYLVAHTPPYRCPVATPDSAMSISSFNSSVFGCDPISATPKRSRRLAKARAKEVVDAPAMNILNVNDFGPDSSPPRTPSPPLLTNISGNSGNRDSSEVHINQRKNKEFAVITDKGAAISTNFITPPCKPLPPPGAPRKERVDKNSRPTIASPSFTQTPVSRGLKKSRTAKRVYRRKYGLHSPIYMSTSSMVLRSALKPRRSPRIKRMGVKRRHNIPMRKKTLH